MNEQERTNTNAADNIIDNILDIFLNVLFFILLNILSPFVLIYRMKKFVAVRLRSLLKFGQAFQSLRIKGRALVADEANFQKRINYPQRN